MTVNEALDSLSSSIGETIQVAGLLAWEFETRSIAHFPKAERREQFELWLEADAETPPLDEELLRRMNGQRVTMTGVLKPPEPKLGGCGHMSLWPGELLVRSITRL